MQSDKLLNLESLRGIAALSVVLYHFQINSHFHMAFIKNAWMMVDFFFVLSGFVIALNYQNKISTTTHLYNFQLKRFFRLYPLHLMILLAFLGIELAKYVVENKMGIEASNPAFSKNNLSSFVANLFLVQNLTMQELTWNAASWSISAEFFTYMVFGVIALLSSRQTALFIPLSALVSLGCLVILSQTYMGVDSITGPARCGYAFFLGVLLCNVYRHFRIDFRFTHSWAGVAAIILAMWAVTQVSSKKDVVALFMPVLFMLVVGVLIFTTSHARVNRVLSHPWLVYLGTISYGVYMIHLVVIWFTAQIFRFVFKIPAVTNEEGVAQIHIDPFVADLVVLVVVGVIIGLAHVSFTHIEMRFNKYRERFSR